MSKLRFFTETITYPDNIDLFLPSCSNLDEIVIGANVEHIIKLPFSKANEEDFLPLINSIEMIYKQGDNTFIYQITPENLVVDNNHYYADFILSPDFTSQFKPNSSLDVIGQLKVSLKTGEIYYDHPYKIALLTPVDEVPIIKPPVDEDDSTVSF